MDPLELGVAGSCESFNESARAVCDLTAEPSPARGHTFGGLLAVCLWMVT